MWRWKTRVCSFRIPSCGADDIDADDVPNVSDNCPDVPNTDQLNSDGDSHGDACDNCVLVDNESQCNTNAPDADPLDEGDDEFGNACDADLDNNGIVNTFDLTAMRTAFGATGANDADLDCNNIVNTFDLTQMRGAFGGVPGPGAN